MTTVPDHSATADRVDDGEGLDAEVTQDALAAAAAAPRRERYAVQRMVAAEQGRLHERMLLNRARSEGEAHRRARPGNPTTN